MSEPLSRDAIESGLREALDDMRAIGAGNDFVVITTTPIRQQMARWGICTFACDAWIWNGYEVRVDDMLPPDNLYVVRRDSVLVQEAI